jgi:hypothetical protein
MRIAHCALRHCVIPSGARSAQSRDLHLEGRPSIEDWLDVGS